VTVLFYNSFSIPGILHSTCGRSDEIRQFALENYAKSETDNFKFHTLINSFFSSLNHVISLCIGNLEFPEIPDSDLRASDSELQTIGLIRPTCPIDQFILSEIHKEKTKILRASDSLEFPSAINLLRGFFSQCCLFYFPSKCSILSGKFLAHENLRRISRDTISVMNFLRNMCEILLQKIGIRKSENHVSEIPFSEDFLSPSQKKKWSSLEKLKDFILKQVKSGIPSAGEFLEFPSPMERRLGEFHICVNLEWDTTQDGFNVKSLLEEDIIPFYEPQLHRNSEIPSGQSVISDGTNGISTTAPAEFPKSVSRTLSNTVLSHFFWSRNKFGVLQWCLCRTTRSPQK